MTTRRRKSGRTTRIFSFTKAQQTLSVRELSHFNGRLDMRVCIDCLHNFPGSLIQHTLAGLFLNRSFFFLQKTKIDSRIELLRMHITLVPPTCLGNVCLYFVLNWLFEKPRLGQQVDTRKPADTPMRDDDGFENGVFEQNKHGASQHLYKFPLGFLFVCFFCRHQP